jgi:hypothetical protein
MPPHIGLLVTGKEAAADFVIFTKTLETWHPDASLYVFTDTATIPALAAIAKQFKGIIHTKVALDAYKGASRAIMEASPGRVYDSQFKDYTYEKAAVLEWMWEAQPDLESAWFMDADITHLAPLPQIPAYATLALSPHYIREADCGLYGKYNAGYMWFKNKSHIDVWRKAGYISRFFEQAALEQVAESAGPQLYEFPIQVNFGWWRMFQSAASPPEIQGKFTIYRPDKSVGIRYDGAPLQSVHTHWSDTSRSAAGVFNTWFASYVRQFAIHKPLAQLRRNLGLDR